VKVAPLLRGRLLRVKHGWRHGGGRGLRDAQPRSARSEQKEPRAGAQPLARQRERGSDDAERPLDGEFDSRDVTVDALTIESAVCGIARIVVRVVRCSARVD